jgi:enoyl-CoA hydratase/carnithine racemase
MSDKTILLDIQDKIGTITLNRPERKNAINSTMVNEWVEILDECRDNPEISAIILTGAGEAFCAGGDKANLGANNKIDPLETKDHFWDHFQRIAKRTALIEKPIVAAVNGMATGAGMDMSLHCDIRFAAKSAIFRASYAAFGLVPGNGGTYFLPRIVGTSKALELFWSTDVIDAEEALRIGLINKVFSADDLMEKTREWVSNVLNQAPIPVRVIKRLIYQNVNMDLNTSLDLISSHMAFARTSEDHAEAIAASEEKRTPKFKGK